MEKSNILFISGMGDSGMVKVSKVQKDGNLLWLGSGSANIANHLSFTPFNIRKVTFDTTEEQKFPSMRIHGVFNQVADPDSHAIVLDKVEKFYSRISGKVPFFNLPSKIAKTSREKIYKELQSIDKLNVPKTIKFQPASPSEVHDTIKSEGFVYPVIFRKTGDHGGISTIRVEDETEQFYAFALDGSNYYLTQFVDYADEEGIYAKMRLVVVDGRVFVRHVIFSDNWIIHSRSRDFMQQNKRYKEREREILASFETSVKPHIQRTIDAIYTHLGLDYFGIDCTLDKVYNMTVFEINANMNVLTNNAKDIDNIWTKQIDIIKEAIVEMITQRVKK